ncbi:hypothetical protein [Pseudorhodoferax soli]|uniref:hypothetical protein n=1 Tax=Pseudorhodoferax soli TaxID=545864 RepID=UPI0011C02BD2|nr:hypothetical protein [Pseudorhodoferax soli]
MENLDIDVLKQLALLKVGEMQKALEGIDPMVRLMDVPAVVQLLNADKLQRQARNREISAQVGKMSTLVRAIGRTFSQDLSRRDLELAAILSAEAGELGKAASLIYEDRDSENEVPTGTFEELLDKAISHAGLCEFFSLATDLQSLGEAVVGGAEDLAEWKAHFAGKKARTGETPADFAQPGRRRPGRPPRLATDTGTPLPH